MRKFRLDILEVSLLGITVHSLELNVPAEIAACDCETAYFILDYLMVFNNPKILKINELTPA